MKWQTVFLGLGSNIGDRRKNLLKALFELNDCTKIKLVKVSSVYETEPLYDKEQDDFFNMVAEIQTLFSPAELLIFCKKIEAESGRDLKAERNSPRQIDIDIEFFENRIIYDNNLKIPHPRILERKFVLEPMAEIASDFLYPGTKKDVKKLLEECEDSSRIIKMAQIQYDEI